MAHMHAPKALSFNGLTGNHTYHHIALLSMVQLFRSRCDDTFILSGRDVLNGALKVSFWHLYRR